MPRLQVRTDPLQRLHTLHNLADTLDSLARRQPAAGGSGSSTPAVARTLRDDSLRHEAAQLRDAYLAARVADLAAQRAAYAKARDAAAGGASRPTRRGRRAQGPRGGAAGGDGGEQVGAQVVQQFAAEMQLAITGTGAGDGSGGSGAEGDGGDGDGDDGDDAAGCGGGKGEEVAGRVRDAWFVGAIDALEAAGVAGEVAAAVKDALLSAETYARAGQHNATSLARR